jgi:hypothetical protein
VLSAVCADARCLLTHIAAQVLFYCHFPDMLLATRSSRLRAAYRAPLDALEQRTTGMVRARVQHLCAARSDVPVLRRRTRWW